MPRRILPIAFALCLPALALPQSTWRDRFDASEYLIPMRDGVKLYTVVFVPKGKPGPFPILMERTPYGAGSPNNAPRRGYQKLNDAGYILAFQDVRGRGKSEGEFINIKPLLKKGRPGTDESTDTFDTVDFLLKTVGSNNGKVGLWGISYPGFYAGAGAVRNHPGLAAVSPQAPVNDWFQGDDVHHNGALFLQETFDFMLGFDVPRGQPYVNVDREGLNAYDFYLKAGALSNYESKFLQGRIPYWKELLDNDTYNQYWKDRALWRSFTDVKCAVLTVGGWFDKEDMYGALQLYRAGEKQNPGTPNFLIMGPWSHGQWASGDAQSLADVPWGSRTGQWYQDNVELPFFERYLKGKSDVPPISEVTMFETGANEWHKLDQWPPKGVKPASLHLDAGRTLSFSPTKATGKESYVSDPASPTPYTHDWATSNRAPGDWLARDQRFLNERTDLVTFSTPPLSSDFRIAGEVEADLWVSSTGTDCDLVVQLIDEVPMDSPMQSASGKSMAGYQFMVRGNIMRGKFRDSFENPKPFVPGQPTRVRFQLNDAMHTFKKGHRVMVRVMSSWFPIADRNPNTFVSRSKATDADFKKATIQVLFGPKTPSQIRLLERP